MNFIKNNIEQKKNDFSFLSTLFFAFLISLLISSTSFSQSIEKFSIDSGGASATAGNISILYSIGEVNVQEVSNGNIQISEGFINAAFKLKIDPILFLQGPLLNPTTSGSMNDDLRTGSYLPTTSPYADAATCNASVFNISGNNAIVDWIWIELRDANDNTKIVNAKSALLQRDGDVVALDGVANLTMSAAPTNYYVLINHRNHLGVISASTFGLNENTTTTVDFSSSSASVLGGTNAVVNMNGIYAIYGGDFNENGQVQNTDISGMVPFLGTSGYSNADLDLNGQTQNTDLNNIINPNIGKGVQY